MNYGLAVGEMIKSWKTRLRLGFLPLSKQDSAGWTPGHARWMLEQIVEHEEVWSDGKKGRWLGWAQALLCFHGFFRLKEMKEINLSCSCDDEDCPYFDIVHNHKDWEALKVPSELGSKRFRVHVPAFGDKASYPLYLYALDELDAVGHAWVNWEGYKDGDWDKIKEAVNENLSS